MDIKEYKAITEGLLFASGEEGLTKKQLVKLLEIDKNTVDHIIEELRFDLEQTSRGVTLMESKQYLHLTTKPEHASFYQKLMDTPQSSRLSQAALETLAIIAYQQPITRMEIEEVRGVKSDRPVQTLLSRDLIEEVGRKEGVGKPILFGTSKAFLTYFGLTSIEELPPLPEEITESDVEEEADLFFEKFQQHLDSNNE